MSNPIKKVAVSTKNFVVKYKTPILVTIATAATGTALVQSAGLKQHDEFLKEHDLFDEFYSFPEN